MKDERTIVEIGRQMLTRLGYNVFAFTDSAEALELFQSEHEKFDLVVCDMTMPKMTGEKLAGKLRSIRPDLPITVCTGSSNRLSELTAEKLGINALLMNPITMSQIGSVIREVLDNLR